MNKIILILMWIGTVLFASGTFVTSWMALILLLPGMACWGGGIYLMVKELKRT
jgi:hypothetical protein